MGQNFIKGFSSKCSHKITNHSSFINNKNEDFRCKNQSLISCQFSGSFMGISDAHFIEDNNIEYSQSQICSIAPIRKAIEIVGSYTENVINECKLTLKPFEMINGFQLTRRSIINKLVNISTNIKGGMKRQNFILSKLIIIMIGTFKIQWTGRQMIFGWLDIYSSCNACIQNHSQYPIHRIVCKMYQKQKKIGGMIMVVTNYKKQLSIEKHFQLKLFLSDNRNFSNDKFKYEDMEYLLTLNFGKATTLLLIILSYLQNLTIKQEQYQVKTSSITNKKDFQYFFSLIILFFE